MAGKRKSHSAAFKAQVALAALKGKRRSTRWRVSTRCTRL
ncbi:hypothetical protein FTUN_8178 [Frigoriglobus tundricola]|uniref:Uncharacterized protein n=1 Tax=Frigoriglobus tundricola TaxID=2774151 RepID=A0A6M5Z281_9BACT|nr:hypothetical protein FTUN_8178 [Frigoriglobus tundricola]